MHKVDGASLSLIYKGGKLVRAITRGVDGEEGFDVTDNAKYVKTIPKTISYKDEVEVRGEIYKDRDDFHKNWSGLFANPRNFAAGAMNQKDSLVTKDDSNRELNVSVSTLFFKSHFFDLFRAA